MSQNSKELYLLTGCVIWIWFDIMYLALVDRNMQVRFGLVFTDRKEKNKVFRRIMARGLGLFIFFVPFHLSNQIESNCVKLANCSTYKYHSSKLRPWLRPVHHDHSFQTLSKNHDAFFHSKQAKWFDKSIKVKNW